jgi:hypothetical protein
MKIKQIAGYFLLSLSLVEGRADTNQTIKGNCNTEVNANGKVTVNINCADSKTSIYKPVEQWTFIKHYQVKGSLVKDMKTGLMWMRCNIGQNWNGSTCTEEAVELSWKQAMNLPQNFDYAGYNDWRVPTIDELESLVDCHGQINLWLLGCIGSYTPPTILSAVFPNTPKEGFFWASSSFYGAKRWGVYFYTISIMVETSLLSNPLVILFDLCVVGSNNDLFVV